MQIDENSKPINNEIRLKMEQYRIKLLANNMYEPTKYSSVSWQWLFYRPTTELTAFVVNLKGKNDCIEVVYGYASTAFTRFAGCKDSLIEQGVDNEYINIHEKIIIYNEEDEIYAQKQIEKMYEKYLHLTKDELLIEAREKRKAFLQKITNKLKPMGFKKKGNSWRRNLEGEYYTIFDAQKSLYSDQYYYNVLIKGDDHKTCYHSRVSNNEEGIMDWQAISEDEFNNFLDQIVVPLMEQFINTPLDELGKLPLIWEWCYCSREECDHCWVEKNYRETQTTNNE